MKNHLQKFLYRQEQLDIFRERLIRMRLVAFAPLVSYALLLFLFTTYSYVINASFSIRIIDATTFIIAIFWLILLANLLKIDRIKTFIDNPSAIFRFAFDLPFLILMLLWVIWCFHITNSFRYPFLLTLYALFVYSGSRMVSIPFYMLGTHLVGISLCLVSQSYYQEIFGQITPQALSKQNIIEIFLSLYIGLYFPLIQEALVLLFKEIARIFSKLLSAVVTDED